MESPRASTNQLERVVWRLAVFAVLFCSALVGFPYLAMTAHRFLPSAVGNFFFFWPQVALVTYGFTAPPDDMTRTILSGGISVGIAAAFWVMVGLALAWLLRRKRVVVTALATLPVGFVIAFLAVLVLRLFGVGIYLEGP